MKFSKGNFSDKEKIAVALLFVIPLLIAAGKWSILPTSDLFLRVFSLNHIPRNMHHRVTYILFVPFGATLVVFFRLFLGIRLLGPFRSILIAVAFQITGIPLGLTFLAMVTGVIVAIRPRIKAIHLPYFARVSVILSAVASLMIIALLSSAWLDLDALRRMAYFPIFALSLTAEGFARTLSKEGLKSATWRGSMTAFVAILITLISQIDGFKNIFLYYPELLIMQMGCIMVIAEFFDLRLLRHLNPPKAKKEPPIYAKKVHPDPSQAIRDQLVQNIPFKKRYLTFQN